MEDVSRTPQNSALILAGHAPTKHRGFDAFVRIEVLPSAIPPSAQERNNIGTDVVLTKELQRLVRRRGPVMNKCVDALSPCCHVFALT